IRHMLQEQGLPPDQIESQLGAMLAKAQRGLPPSSRAPDPPRQPPPGFGEGFADRWFSTEQSIKNLLGQGGPGAPGVLESWGGLLKGTAETVVNPAGAAVEEIKNAVNSPSPAYYLGEKTFDAASTAATLPWGGEGAAIRGGLPVRTIAEGGAPEALVRGWDPTGGMPWDEFGPRFGTPDSRIWPDNNGFPPGYDPQPAQLPPGTIIDRFGHEGGRYLAPDGTPFADRALTPETVVSEYHRYSVTEQPLPDGWQIVEGPVEPWYGQTPSPGTVQYMIVGPQGVRVSVEELVDRGILTEHGPVLGYEYK
ncbi:MAG: TNT domain-containing protein, partial [Mycobacterium sp.]